MEICAQGEWAGGLDSQEGESSRETTLASTTGKGLSLPSHRRHGGANFQGTSEEGCWVIEKSSSARSQAGDGAGDRLESLLLAAEVSDAGRLEVGADGLTARGRWPV